MRAYSLPYFRIELVLEILFLIQLLKFAVDYFPIYWMGSPQPVFLYLDLSYYFNLVSPAVFFNLVLLWMVVINLYWMLPLLLFLYGVERSSDTLNNFCKALFLLFRNVLLLPAFNVFLEYSPTHTACSIATPYPITIASATRSMGCP